MKKIVCLLLALTCVFALFSCKGEDPQAAFFAMIEESEPTSIITQTTHTRENGITYNGMYTTAITEDGFVFEYKYETVAAVVPGADTTNSVQTTEGEIVYNGSRYSTDGGTTWVDEAPDVAYMQIKLALTKENIGEYEMSRDGKTLTATISKDAAKAIFGTAVSADSAVLKITVDGTRLSRVTLAYTTSNATEVIVETSYTYEPAPAADAE